MAASLTRRRRRRLHALLLLTFALLGLAGTAAVEADEPRRPIPEAGFIEQVPAAPCTPESDYDMPDYYGAKCKRLRFVFGPIAVKPGQNDLLIQPVTIEKPSYDGYITRFKPNLIDPSGVAPPVEQLHLHHATWLQLTGEEYGSGPFMASGEEKTIPFWPHRYGMKVLGDDKWGLLHMVHNALATPTVVWVIYDIDFVKAGDAEAVQPDGKPLLTNTKSIWLDVGGGSFHPETETYPFNPIYNVQRGHGTADPAYANKLTCTFPSQNCARYNSLGNVSAQQGKDVSAQVLGKDWRVPNGFLGETKKGTLVVMGGHLHPGGLDDKISLVRNGVEKPILTSEALYWTGDGTVPGGDPTSWDFSMTVGSKDIGWGVQIQEGDIIRLDATYDSDMASWYENMGIVMTWVAPGDLSGVDVFAEGTTLTDSYPVGAKLPPGMTGTCTPSSTNLCLRGQVTHDRYQENQNHGPCAAGVSCPPLTIKKGPAIQEIDMGGFTYGAADLGVIGQTGIPQVKKSQPLKFVNLDTADYMWHTVTSCKVPCSGPTKVDYPIADGGNGSWDDVMDFDSSELGIGLYPAQRVDWTLTPDKTGLYTFFCRIHPSMRGAFEVVE